MANQPTPQTKVETPNDQLEVAPGTISLEELDKAIQENDPDFQQSVSGLSGESGEKQNLEMVDLDRILAEEQAKSIKARVIRFYKHFTGALTIFLVRTKSFLNFVVKEGIPAFFTRLKALNEQFSDTRRNFYFTFKDKPLGLKLIFLSGIFLSLFLVYFLYLTFKGEVIPEKSSIFVNTIEEGSDLVFTFSAKEQFEPFYDSTRVNQNVMALRRIIVNIRPSKDSGPNPMASIEFFIEGNSSEVVVEMKDREYQVLDRIQRIIEEMNYNELDSPEGKQKLLERVRKELNSFLTRGKVKRLFFKNAVIKS